MIGIDSYAHPNINKLRNAVSDVLAVKELLTQRYQFEEANTIMLTNEQATRNQITQKFRYLVGKLAEQDSLLVYYAGHGHYDDTFDAGYWIPVEGSEEIGSFLPNSSLIEFIKPIKAKHVFLVSDSCFSGTLLAETRDAFTNRVKDLPSRWGLCSGRKELVLDKSLFATSLLDFLQTNTEEKLLVRDLISYVERNTANNAEQTPFGNRLKNVGDKGGEFVFELKESQAVAWQNAVQQNTLQSYKEFLEKYPQAQGSYIFQAENALIQLNEAIDEQAYQTAQRANTSLAYYDYLEDYRNGKYASEAKAKMKEREKAEKEQEAKNALATAKYNHSLSELMDFKDKYKNFPLLIADANTIIAEIRGGKAASNFDKHEPIDKGKAQTEYTELFTAFYEDNNISPSERKQLQKKQAELRLTDSAVKEIEELVIQELSKKTRITAEEVVQKPITHRTSPYLIVGMVVLLLLSLMLWQPWADYKMVNVEGGTFQMGYDPDRDGEDELMADAKPLHNVTVSSFNMGKYEVTQAEWKAIMGSNPSNNKNCDNCPVGQVSWNDIQDFLKKLNQNTGKKYRLPSEEEWEYAARGGNKSNGYKYAGESDTPSSVAWTDENSGSKAQPVGTKSSNELGIYDMSGNVFELTSSGWSDNYEEPRSSQYFVRRGGAWLYPTTFCRVAYRGAFNPIYRYSNFGFRLAHDF